MTTQPCCTEQELTDFELGNLPGERFEQIAAHLDVCTTCATRFERLPEQPDTVLDHLRLPLPEEILVDDPELKELADRAVSLLDTGVTMTSETSTGKRTHSQDIQSAITQILGPTESDDELGRLGGYRVLEVLGVGGMGIVFRAEDPVLQRTVALKVMKPSIASDAAARERFLREVRGMAAVEHDHIVTIHQVGEERDVPFLAMPLLKGESLSARLQREGRMESGEALRITAEAARGLAAAHTQGLVHRDIKPDNIWLEEGTGRVKILDFGLARAVDAPSEVTQSGQVLGTASYLSPEQASGETVDARSDLFSLGVTLYQMLTGRRPFDRPSLMATLKAIGCDEPEPIAEELDEQTPAEISALVSRLLQKEPDSRFQTADELLTAVDAVESGRKIPQVASAPETARPQQRILLAVAGLFAAVFLAGIIVIVRDKDGKITGWFRVPPGGSVETTEEMEPATTPESEADASGTPWHSWPADAPKPAIAPFNADEAKAQQHAWAKYLGVPVEYTNSIGMKFRLIPPGEFLMGSTDRDRLRFLEEAKAARDRWATDYITGEGPQHRVWITQPFYLSVNEITQSQYAQVMGTDPSHFSSTGEGNEKVAGRSTSNHPVETVSWFDAVEFCNKLSDLHGLRSSYEISDETVTQVIASGYRLPTEAEWEFACRAGTSGAFSYSQGSHIGEVGWYKGNSSDMTHPVGAKSPNGFGLHDMLGNVWEWCHDWYSDTWYLRSNGQDAVDPAGPTSGAGRVHRGGCWSDVPGGCRSAHRIGIDPQHKGTGLGFRVALAIAGSRAGDGEPGRVDSSSLEAIDPYARDVAEWVLSLGGEVSVANENIAFATISEIDRLPAAPFELQLVKLTGDSGNYNPIDLVRLVGLPALNRVWLTKARSVDESTIDYLLQCPLLVWLNLDKTSLRSADFRRLQGLPMLLRLTVSPEQIDDDWAFLEDLPNLRNLDVSGLPIQVVPTIEQLAKYSQLHTLELRTVDDLDPELVERFQSMNPGLRVLVRHPDRNKKYYRLLGADPVADAARTLVEQGWTLAGGFEKGEQATGEWNSQTSRPWEGSDLINVTRVAVPPDRTLSDEELQLLPRLSLHYYTIYAAAVTDTERLVPAIVACRHVSDVRLENSDLTDSGLEELSELIHLDRLSVYGTEVTQAAIEAFKRRVPRCEVTWDGGKYEAEHRLPQGWGDAGEGDAGDENHSSED